MVQDHQLVCLQGQRGVRSSVVVTEFDFEHLLCKLLDHGTHLTTNQTSFGKIHGQGNHVQQLDSLTHGFSQDKTTHEAGTYLKTSSAAEANATTPVESVFSASG